ncbi:hypothetical protein ACSVCE_11120 [Chromobacterium haemolyticum]|uniref:hypothetical protein n=1 Tax=Chromobacterium haemolyticum TaxID=394935 RepID=UPI00405593A5
MRARETAALGWRRLKRVLTWPLALLAALIILFEEYAWDELSAALGRLAAWPPLAALERRIAALPPWAALAIFALPAALLLPVKLAALFLIGRGHALLGVLIILLAKVGGTALAARLFTLTRPTLMRVSWFVWLYSIMASFTGASESSSACGPRLRGGWRMRWPGLSGAARSDRRSGRGWGVVWLGVGAGGHEGF